MSHQQGARAALAHFGLVKQALSLREILVGDPGKFMQQLGSGELFTGKGVIAQAMNPISPHGPLFTGINLALQYGLPAYGLYQAAQAPESSRGSALGATLGGLAGGTVGAPLGVLGSLGGGFLGGELGEALGRQFNQPHAQRRETRATPAPKGSPSPESRRERQTPAHTQAPLSAEMSDITQRPTY